MTDIKPYTPSEHTLAEDLDVALELADKLDGWLVMNAGTLHSLVNVNRTLLNASALVILLRGIKDRMPKERDFAQLWLEHETKCEKCQDAKDWQQMCRMGEVLYLGLRAAREKVGQ